MSRLSLGKPFKDVKEIDIGMMQAFIEACVGPRSLLVDMNYGQGHYKSFSLFTFE